jgi:cell wall-associated NlpC family hydrolase
VTRVLRTILILSIALCVAAPSVCARDAVDQLKLVVKHQNGLNKIEKRQLESAIKNYFDDVPGLRPRVFSSVQAIINAGLFEMSANTGDEDGPISAADMARICRVARATYQAIQNGAEPNLAEDLAIVGFAREITAGQIEAAAKALAELMVSGIDAETYQEIISQALDNGWAPDVTRSVSAGLIEGARKELDTTLLTLTLIIGVAQDLDAQGITQVVQNAQSYVRNRQTASYEALKKALSAGLSPPVAKEIYYIGMEEGWPAEVTVSVFEGLVRGQKMGLTPEKLATSLIVRVEQGLDDTPVALAVQEEIDFVKKFESQRIELIQKDPKLKKSYESPQQWTQIAYAPPAKDEVPIVSPASGPGPASEPEAAAEPAPPEAKPAVAAAPAPEPPKATPAPAAVEPKPATPPAAAPFKPAAPPQEEVTQAPEAPPAAEPKPAAPPVEAPPAPEPAPAPEQTIAAKPEAKPAAPTPTPPPTQPAPAPEKPATPKPAPETPSTEHLAAQLEEIQRALMQGSINDFLGTPYKWGGTAKKRGTDCSGFTQGVFRDGGVQIPRVSRIQFKKTPLKLKQREELVWGDLVFFNKNGGPDTYITHVGMYMGKDDKGIERFVHSCCSKGVTISRFNKRYYLSRFVGGARPAEVKG